MNENNEKNSHVKAAKDTKTKRPRKARIFASPDRGKIGRILKKLFVILSVVVAAAAVGIVWIRGPHYGTGAVYMYLFSAILFLMGFFVFLNVWNEERRINRFRYYKTFLEGRDYMLLSEMAKITARKVPFLQKDLAKMMDDRLFIQARLNEQGTCLFLTREAFRRYQRGELIPGAENEAAKETYTQDEAQRSYEKEPKESQDSHVKEEGLPEPHVFRKKRKQEPVDSFDKAIIKDKVPPFKENIFEPKEEIRDSEEEVEETEDFEIVCEGNLHFIDFWIQEIREPDIIKTASEICVRGQQILYFKDSEMAKEVERFLLYYLPVTNNVLETYVELAKEELEMQGADLKVILNTIQHSFDSFVDKLMEGKRLDVEADIAATEMMLLKQKNLQ